MEQDPIFALFHKYNKLVRRDLAPPLRCTTCNNPLVTGMGENDELVLNCLTCNSIIKPGIGIFDNVRAIVMEHFTDGI